MRRLLIALFGFLPLLSPHGVAAQQIPSPYRYIEETQSLGVFGSYLWTDAQNPDLGPQPASLVGLEYTVRFSGPAAGIASLAFIPSERTVFSNAATLGDTISVIPQAEGTTRMPLLLVEAGVRFTVTGARTWNGIAPYLAATGGVIADLGGDGEIEVEEDERLDFGPGFAVGVRAGAEWFVGNRWSLRAEARDQIWRIRVPPGLLVPGRDESRWTNNLGLSLGTAFHF